MVDLLVQPDLHQFIYFLHISTYNLGIAKLLYSLFASDEKKSRITLHDYLPFALYKSNK